MTRLTIVEQVVLAGFRNRKSISKIAKEIGISASYLYKLLDEIVPMTEAVELRIKNWLDNSQLVKEVSTEEILSEINTQEYEQALEVLNRLQKVKMRQSVAMNIKDYRKELLIKYDLIKELREG
jgi:transposase-like protein